MTATDGRILFAHRTRAGPIWHTMLVLDWVSLLTAPTPPVLLVKSTCRGQVAQDYQKWQIRTFDAHEMVQLMIDGENVCWTCLWA